MRKNQLSPLYDILPGGQLYQFSEADKSAYVSVDRCKSCEICVYICNDVAKNNAIEMKWIENLEDRFVIKRIGLVVR